MLWDVFSPRKWTILHNKSYSRMLVITIALIALVVVQVCLVGKNKSLRYISGHYLGRDRSRHGESLGSPTISLEILANKTSPDAAPSYTPLKGSSHGWDRFKHGSHIGLNSAEVDAEFWTGPLDSYAEKVFFMLKTGHKVLRDRLPVHFYTQLTRWPHHAIYADVSETVNGVEIVDVFSMLSQSFRESQPDLEDYRILQKSIRENWGIDYDQFSSDQGWDSDRFKNIPMLAHAWQNCPHDTEWFVFVDDDTYIHQWALLDHLKTYRPDDKIYLGSPALITYNDETVIFAHGGSGVVISRGAMAALFGNDHSDTEKIYGIIDEYTKVAEAACCGDAVVAIALEAKGQVKLTLPWGEAPEMKDPFQGADLGGVRIEDGGWCVPVMTWHHLTSREVEQLFIMENQYARNNILTFADVYRIMILPYISEERSDWDSYARDWVFDAAWFEAPDTVEAVNQWNDALRATEVDLGLSEGQDPVEHFRPYHSADSCRASCQMVDGCLEWTWQPGQCRLEVWRIVHGRASNNHIKGVDGQESIKSGWMLDRIRNRRWESECDPLTYDERNNIWSDDEATSEGWFLRELAAEAKQDDQAANEANKVHEGHGEDVDTGSDDSEESHKHAESDEVAN